MVINSSADGEEMVVANQGKKGGKTVFEQKLMQTRVVGARVQFPALAQHVLHPTIGRTVTETTTTYSNVYFLPLELHSQCSI